MRDQARLCHGREFWNAFVKPLQVHPTAGYDMSTGHWAQFSKSAFPNAEHIEMETSKDFEEHVLSILQSFALKHRYQMVLQMVLNRPLSAEPEAFLAIVYLGLDIREPQNRWLLGYSVWSSRYFCLFFILANIYIWAYWQLVHLPSLKELLTKRSPSSKLGLVGIDINFWGDSGFFFTLEVSHPCCPRGSALSFLFPTFYFCGSTHIYSKAIYRSASRVSRLLTPPISDAEP